LNKGKQKFEKDNVNDHCAHFGLHKLEMSEMNSGF